jgi:hypothetical protein
MIELLQGYGLWIVLGVVFLAMHKVGMGCCGGGHRHGPVRRAQAIAVGPSKTGEHPEETRDARSICH